MTNCFNYCGVRSLGENDKESTGNVPVCLEIIRIEDPHWEFDPDLTAPCFSNSSVYSNILIRCILFRFLY